MDLIYNHIYKPKRLLYYVPTTKENKEQFFQGKVPEELALFDGAFGTYDCPGLFKILDGNDYKNVIGIEYRPGDDRIMYPDLECIELEPNFMISVFLTRDALENDEMIFECIDYVKKNIHGQRFYLDYIPMDKCEIIQAFTSGGKSRVFIQAEYVPYESFFKYEDAETDGEKKLQFAAFHDPITEFYNWNYLCQIIGGFGYKGIQDFQMVHFDVKDFNALNVIYGHDVANNVLYRIANQIQKPDWVYHGCRCDNDNFAMMIKDMPLEETKKKLLDFFEEISDIPEDSHYHIFYRCGVAPMRNCLLLGDRVADGAKQAQRLGTRLNATEVNFYTDVMHDELDWAKRIKAYLDVAIENDELLVYFQPKYDIDTETIKGAEALIRWNYMGKQMLSPYKFIPIFEKDGSIAKVDDIVLKKVCEYFCKWKQEGKPLFPVSVNLSRKRLENPELIEHLTAIVDSYGVDHSLIDFELTESAAYDDQTYMITVIKKLKELGFKVSMDDFGTGFSSLSLLTMMPIDTLKIDKSFVDGIGTSKETYKERAVIQHIISMAKALNFGCLAEGAEDKAQVDRLKEYGCELVQGYYYSKPVPVSDYEQMIQKYY